jgi:hypothetical protein
MISIADGGMIMPSTDEPATTPTAKRGLYFWASICGTETLVKTEADAMEDPVTAAKTALAPTVPIPIPPLTLRNRMVMTS